MTKVTLYIPACVIEATRNDLDELLCRQMLPIIREDETLKLIYEGRQSVFVGYN